MLELDDVDTYVDSYDDNMDEDRGDYYSLSYRGPRLVRSLTEGEFVCSCCFEIMVDPTTLNCGHSFCRHCVAQSYLITKQSACLLCRTSWEKNPQVNILLRKTIETLFFESVESRKKKLKAEGVDTIIQEFEETLSKSYNTKTQRIWAFFKGFFFSIAAGVFCSLIWIWYSSGNHLLIQKPVDHWEVQDVEQWIMDFGQWAHNYQGRFVDNKVDGHLLLSLTEDDLYASPFNITYDPHRRAFKKALEDLREHGLKTPTNFWEYKHRYRGKSLFLLYGLRMFPRTTMFSIYLFDHDATFYPFLKTVSSPELLASDDKYDNKVEENTSDFQMWIDFLPKFVFLPYILILQFALRWLDVNYWISRFVICMCVLFTFSEANGFRWTLRVGIRAALIYIFKQLLMLFSLILILFLFWPLIPRLITDCLFYWILYWGSFIQVESFIRGRDD